MLEGNQPEDNQQTYKIKMNKVHQFPCLLRKIRSKVSQFLLFKEATRCLYFNCRKHSNFLKREPIFSCYCLSAYWSAQHLWFLLFKVSLCYFHSQLLCGMSTSFKFTVFPNFLWSIYVCFSFYFNWMLFCFVH